MIILRKDRLLATLVSTCISGLAISPFIYIATGAPLRFSMAFCLIFIPPVTAASGFLLWRFFSKPKEDTKKKFSLLVAEGISWIAIIFFIVVVSRINLMTISERIGLFFMFFLVALIFCLPVTIVRETDLVRRLSRLSNGVLAGLLFFILGVSVVITIWYLVTPEDFI